MQGQSKRFIYDTSQRMHTPCQQRQKNLFVQRAFKENVDPKRNRVQVVRLVPQVAAVNLFDGEHSKYLRAAMVLQKNTLNKHTIKNNNRGEKLCQVDETIYTKQSL